VKRWAIECSELYIITFPFGFHTELDHYPAILRHLKKFESLLKQRGQCTSSRNGKSEGQHHWLELDNNPKTSFLEAFETPKIVSTKLSIRPTFAYDLGCNYLANTSYFFSASSDAHYLLALLNSALFQAYAKKVFVEKQNGWYEVQPDGLESFPIPAASTAEQAVLSGLVDGILAAKRTGNAATVTALEAEIDKHVFRLYALTPAEIKIVKGSNP
jgi:adenine-specific DNA-methyltransferase